MNLLRTVTVAFVLGATGLTTNTGFAFDVENKANRVADFTQAATGYFIEQLVRRTVSAVATFGDGSFVLSNSTSVRPGLLSAELCLKIETFAVGEYKASVRANLGVRYMLGASWSPLVPVIIETN
jgi:hypothetical protein